jgi:REP element-mobilizing transposase RayT
MRVPGGTFLVTCTTHDSRFLLKPCPVVEQVVLYCLFRAAARYGVLVHAAVVESSHIHLVVTDTRGLLSDFMTWLDRHVAVCLLEHYRAELPDRRIEAIWSRQGYNATLLVNHNAILDAIVYCLTNPVKDGLVPDYRKWPGLCSRPRDWLLPARTVRRPELFFKSGSSKHDQIDYRFTIPPQFVDRSPVQLVADVEALIRDKHSSVHSSRAGKAFLGVRAVLAADPFDAPSTQRPRFTRNPTVKASGDHAAYDLARKAVRAFREAYREAWSRFSQGLRAVFPAATVLMRARYRVACEPDDFGWCCRPPA